MKRLNLFHNRIVKMHVPILFLLSINGYCANQTFESAYQTKSMKYITPCRSTYLHDNKKSLRIKVTESLKMMDLVRLKPILIVKQLV